MQSMSYFYQRVDAHIKKLNAERKPKQPKWTFNLIARRADIPSGHPSLWKRWEKTGADDKARLPSDSDLRKMAEVEGLGLDYPTLQTWYLMSKYDKDVLLALNKTIERELDAN